MKDLKFVTVCPDHVYFTWQVHLWLESLKDIEQVDKAVVLIFIQSNRNKSDKWQKIIDLYPEAEFHFYKDEQGHLNHYLSVYIPVLRPFTLWKHFKKFPELSNKAIFYCDSDILFTKEFNINNFIDDKVCYLSNTNSYINANYFESKIKDVLPDKLEEYKNRDVLAEIMSLIGLDKQVAIDNNEHSGGAQYLLKNVDAYFWNKVMNDCILIKTYLERVNKQFFENESKGFQSWCSDMWSVLWNIWLRDQEAKVVPEMDFAWSTDPISRLTTANILHNSGLTSNEYKGWKAFYKGKYHSGADPTKDPHLDEVLESEETKKYCNWHYANELKKLSIKYQLNY
jgi:hypothetical protein